jgi:hypothetical protein
MPLQVRLEMNSQLACCVMQGCHAVHVAAQISAQGCGLNVLPCGKFCKAFAASVVCGTCI